MTNGPFWCSPVSRKARGGFQVCAWDLVNGLTDLGLITTSPDGDVWSDFTFVNDGNNAGYVIGRGVISGQDGESAFLLVPVPEPGSFALLGLGAASLLARRRR